MSSAAVLRHAINTTAWVPSNDQWSLLLQSLPEIERNEVLYFRHYDDQKRAMVSRLLQRACVMQALGEPWDQIVIKRTKGKKPFYAGHITRPHAPNFNYNVSHEVLVYCSTAFCFH
jgi:4'-phosphopantetheinyl transferase